MSDQLWKHQVPFSILSIPLILNHFPFLKVGHLYTISFFFHVSSHSCTRSSFSSHFQKTPAVSYCSDRPNRFSLRKDLSFSCLSLKSFNSSYLEIITPLELRTERLFSSVAKWYQFSSVRSEQPAMKNPNKILKC